MSLSHQLFLQCLREVDELSEDAFDEYRAPLIERFLDHIWRESPYCRERIFPLVTAAGFDIDRWAELPVLRPSEIAAIGPGLSAANLPPDAADTEDVAQNSFLPVSRSSEIARIAAECVRERAYELGGIASAARMAILHPDHEFQAETGKGWSITFPDSGFVRGEASADPVQQAEWLARSGCKRLRTTGAIAAAIAATDTALALETVIVADDDLSDERRKLLEERFGANVVHIVARPVIGPIAVDAAGAGEWFVPSANMIVEVVDPAGRPVAAGAAGELVVTPLYEYASPLLRLATGLGVVAPSEPGAMLGVRRIGGIAGAVSG